MGSFDISGVSPYHRLDLVWIPIDDFDVHADESTLLAFFHYLQVVPVFVGFWQCCRSAFSTIGRYLPRGLEHGFTISPFPIG